MRAFKWGIVKDDAKKSSKNVLLNNAKRINLRVKPQAKGQNDYSIALKWGIVCLCESNGIGDI